MAIGKMLNLGGIDNRPPKTNQSINRFRVARNVYPTPDGKLIPRYDWESPGGMPVRVKAYHHITQYSGDPLSVTSQDIFNTGPSTEQYRFFRGIDPIPMVGFQSGSPFEFLSQDSNNSVMSYRRNNTVYFLLPYQGTLVKYDGVQMWPCGMGQPEINSPAYNSAGTNFVRVIQHSIDFDNNDVLSEYVQFPITPAASITVNIGVGSLNIVPSLNVLPESRILTTAQYSYFKGTAVYNAGSQDYSITATETNITDITKIGSYVFCGISSATINPGSGLTPVLGFALKVKSVSPLVLDANSIKYLNLNREWITSFSTATGLAASITYGTQTMMSFWKSASANGIYYYAGFSPSFPSTGTPFPVVVNTGTPTLAVAGSTGNIVPLGPILNDIYDVLSRKLSPNSSYPFGLNQGLYGMAVYQDSLLLASDDLIWLSDPTLGGTFEQLNTSAFIRVGDTEYGRITSICATSDFLLVSRERKNYFVVGNLVTGNYRVQEVIEAEIGAWSNNSSILVKDSVIFLTAAGVFQIVGGGKATKLSDTCPKNFARYDGTNVNEDVSFVMSGTVSDITNTTIDGISVAYDEYRELLVFMKQGVVNNPCLVLHASSGEFYEWDGMYAGVTNVYGNCLGFINASYYIGAIDYTATPNAIYGFESTAVSRTYAITNPIKLCISWLTGGEPSLEKNLLQLKFFGRIQANPNSLGANYPINIFHYKDWDITTKITNTEYYPQNTALSLNNQIQYSHKKRLTSDKVLSASVGLEINTSGAMFELESIEVEFTPIQEGMKK